MKLQNCTCFALVIFLLTAASMASGQSPSAAPKRPVTDEYQGVNVTDDYRWLENWDDAEVKRWTAAENVATRKYLDQVQVRGAVKERLQQLFSAQSTTYSGLRFRGGMLFAIRHQPSQQEPVLVAMRAADDPASARVVFDANVGSGQTSLAIDYYTPSLDGKYVAVALSKGGSEDSSAHIFEVATGKELPDVVPRVNFATAGGSIDWKGDSSGFYYTRYPQGNERPAADANFYQQVYFHKLGTDPREDSYVMGRDFPRIAEIQLQMSDDGRWLLAAVANGDGGEFAFYLMNAAGQWTQVTRLEDGIEAAKIGPDEALYMLSRKDAPRGKILRLPLAHLALDQAKVIVPQSPGKGAEESARASIEDFQPTPGHLYVVDIVGGPSRLRVFSLQGEPLPSPPLPSVSAVESVVGGGKDVLLHISTWLEPGAWYRIDNASGKMVRSAFYETSTYNFDDAEVVRDFATSKDGTRVPMMILRRKGTKLNGSNPVLLTGYGGYDISEKPHFAGPFVRSWLDQGGIYVDANLRGGGEYGEEWHNAGKLTRKQNVFDDFIGCAQFLIEQKYTSPAHLAILGGSNGGLLMGAAFTQHPELFRAVVSEVGIYDMLRTELDPNGAFNVTEFGTVKDPAEFKALYAYSPYHHVKDGTAYPAILFLTGDNDHRVNPMQSRKMTARLQAANSSGHPILLRTSAKAGHGIGTALDERIEQESDILSFLFDQLGISYVAVKE
jgi:prolyl oligopeptidase